MLGQGGRAGRWRLQRRSPKNSRTGIQRMMSGGRRTGEAVVPPGARVARPAGKISNSSKYCGAAGEEKGSAQGGKGETEASHSNGAGGGRKPGGGRGGQAGGEERQETEGWGNIEGRSRVGIFIFFSSPGEAEADRTMYRRVVGQEAATAPHLSSGLTAGQTLTRVAGGCRAAYAACRQGCQGLAGQAASG